MKSTVDKTVDPHRSENFIPVGVVAYAGDVEYVKVSFLIRAKSPLPVPRVGVEACAVSIPLIRTSD